ncbi:MAG: peptidase S11, partial [Formivibrio sp.]|nr:peptidase S11 [Formivibrio sp.]
MKTSLSILSLLFAFAGTAAVTSNAVAKEPAPLRENSPHLASGSALLIDLQTNKVIYESRPDAVLPIASVTKLMTAMVTLDARLSMSEELTVDISQTKEMKGVYSRVKLGSTLNRHDMLLIALMSSENRAAATLAHHYTGGYNAFIAAMNAK